MNKSFRKKKKEKENGRGSLIWCTFGLDSSIKINVTKYLEYDKSEKKNAKNV